MREFEMPGWKSFPFGIKWDPSKKTPNEEK